jgi:hypothetical protein
MTNDNVKTFLRGGNATFTLESAKTGKHYTFKAVKAGISSWSTGTVIFISLLTGSDNENSYHYLGTLFLGKDGKFTYRITKASPTNSLAHKAMEFLAALLNAGKPLENHNLIFRHAGKCCVCGRKLTTPESIDSGIGPVCAEKM